MTQSPIFVGGMYKSGTTLLRAMLGQHSHIASGLETYWFDWDWSGRDGATMREAFARLVEYFDLPSGRFDELASNAESAEAFLHALMTEVARSQGKRRWLEKTPGNIAHVDRIWSAWPNAQVLHIVRDPRDVFASLVEAKKWSSADEFADRWCSTIGEGERLVAAIAPDPGLYLSVRYERLIGMPDATMRDVLGFLGEPWEPQVAVFEGREEDYKKVLKATGKASTTLERLKKPLTAQRVGIWKKVLSERQTADISDAIFRRGFGYLYERVTAQV